MANTYNKKPNGKNATGRPSKYKPEYCDEIIEFFNQPPYEDFEIPHYDKHGAVKWNDIKRMPRKLPTLVEFANHIKVGVSTVYDWIDNKHSSYQKKFSDTFIRAKKIQENFLIQNGLQGLYNPLFAKFVAINLTDMRDKTEVEHSGEVTESIVELSKMSPKQLKQYLDKLEKEI